MPHLLSPHSFFSPKSQFLSLNHSKFPAKSLTQRLTTMRKCYTVPGITPDEVSSSSDEAFRRYSDSNLKRNGNGVAILWFRNDLRLIDNEALIRAWLASEFVLPVYCVDTRLFGTTHYFGFQKTGAFRAQFLIECIADLKKNLISKGLNLLVRHGKPEDVLPSLAKSFGAYTVYAHKETCSEELFVEQMVQKGLQKIEISHGVSSSNKKSLNPKLQLIWGNTLYHIDDLPFRPTNLPDVYTQFRKVVESKCTIRRCLNLPLTLGPTPKINGSDEIGDWGTIPTLEQLGLSEINCEKGMRFMGGENAALARMNEYFWQQDKLRVYKETRNGMLGPDYSTKFSPWLASGSLSPRYIYEEVKRYEKQRISNDSTYWVLFELIWRDYFRLLSIKYGNSIFHLGGPRKVVSNWSQDKALFESWKEGRTGYPLIDANMKELSCTGFMSNRGRQIVCSFLVRDLGIDWRMGAEWFETCLIDYDPASNYGNWTYGAGVGNDPREDRYFSIPKQAKTYDPEGEYVAYWLQELESVPKERRNFPGNSYIKQIVPLKFDNSYQKKDNFRRERGRARNIHTR